MAKEKDYPLNQVHQQRMLYSNYDTGTLSALKLGNGQSVVLNNGENPVVQTDLFGNVVYSGQSDGLFHAYDMMTLKPIFTVNTGSRNFAPSLKTGGMLMIRTDNKLLAIKLPSSIKSGPPVQRVVCSWGITPCCQTAPKDASLTIHCSGSV
jgi:outer membrane protein assembly factor BamB